MIFFFTSHVSKKTNKLGSVVAELSHKIANVVTSNKYFSVNFDIFILVRFEEPDHADFFKYRRPRLSRKRNIDGEIISYKFEYEFVILTENIGSRDLVKVLKEHLINSLSFFDRIKVLDAEPLKQDIYEAVITYEHSPVYLNE